MKSELESLRQRHQEEDASYTEDVSKEVAKLREAIERNSEEVGKGISWCDSQSVCEGIIPIMIKKIQILWSNVCSEDNTNNIHILYN